MALSGVSSWIWAGVVVLASAALAGAQQRDPVRRVLDELAGLPRDAQQAKLDKLALSPFDFFRGTAHLFWGDLGQDPRLARFGGAPETRTWLIGDAHPENFGTFARGAVVYDLNDFDEVVIADYQLDLWRLAVGLELAARAEGFGKGARRAALRDLADAYSEALAECSGTDRELTPADPSRLGGVLSDLAQEVAQDESRARMLREWTRRRSGDRTLDLRLDELEPLGVVEEAFLRVGFRAYVARASVDPAELRIKSVARRLGAGTGSLGVARYYVQVEGPSADPDDDRVLDVKAQPAPAPAPWLGQAERRLLRGIPNSAARTLAGERALLGLRADPLAGWFVLGGRSYSVRERSPYKGGLDLDELRSRGDLREVARAWGRLLALGHARADRDADPRRLPHSFDDAVTARLRHQRAGFARLVAEVAHDYADQVEDDHEALEDHLGR